MSLLDRLRRPAQPAPRETNVVAPADARPRRDTTLVRRSPAPRGGAQATVLGIARIADGVVTFAGGERCALLAVAPIDLAALGAGDRERLYLAYHALLNGLDGPIQIVARHARHGLEEYRDRHAAWVRATDNPRLARLGEGQAAHLRDLVRRRLLVRQQFLVAIPDPVGQRPAARLRDRLGALLPSQCRHPDGRGDPGVDAPDDERDGRLASRCALVVEGLRAAGLAAHHLDDLAIVNLLRDWCAPDLARFGPVAPATLAAADPDGAADLVAPGYAEIAHDTLRLDGQWLRGIVASALPRPVGFGWLQRLAELVEHVDVAYHIIPRDRAQELRAIRRRLGLYGSSEAAEASLGKVADNERRLAQDDNVRLQDGIQRGVETPFDFSLTLLVRARRRDELDERTGRVLRLLHALQLEPRVAWLEQDRAFLTALPGGRDLLRRAHDADTTSLALSFPFIGRGLAMPNGILCGLGSHDAVLLDPFDRDPHAGLKNANMLVVGVAGSGKSQAVKALCARALVAGIAWVILDPERDEYRPLCDAAGGSWVALGGDGGHAINPFDLPPRLRPADAADADPDEYRDPVDEAVAGLVELVELMAADPGRRLDRAARALLEEALYATYAGAGIRRAAPATWDTPAPLLLDLDGALAARQDAPDTPPPDRERLVALRAGLAPFASGSLAGLCGRPTTVDFDADLVVFNLAAVPAAQRPVAAQLVGQFVWRQLRRHPERRRLVYLDEAWTFLASPAGATFLERASRQFRKYGAGLVVATQELADFLGHPAGRVVLAQAETKLLLAQSATTADQLADVLKLTAPQRQFLLRAAPGQALLLAGTRCLPLTIEANADELAIGETRPERKAAATAHLRQRFADLPPATNAAVVPITASAPPTDAALSDDRENAPLTAPEWPTPSGLASPHPPEVVSSNGTGHWDWRARR